MVSQDERRKVGSFLSKFLDESIGKVIPLRCVVETLKEGRITDAKLVLLGTLIDGKAAYERDPQVVAEQLVGSPVTYVGGLSKVVSGLITSTVAYHEPKGNCAEIFTASPGTFGVFYTPAHGGSSALVIAAHEHGKKGLVGIEQVTVGNERPSKRAIAELFGFTKEKGKLVEGWDSRVILQPRLQNVLAGYAITKKEENGGTYFTLRQHPKD